MPTTNRTLRILILLVLTALCAAALLADKPKASGTAVKNVTVTGQHRGYTNDELYLQLDDGKEMKFLVQIPGDKDGAWHKQFETLSRITVTYHEDAGKKQLIATAIVKAEDPGKK